jgi:hypothetical protein
VQEPHCCALKTVDKNNFVEEIVLISDCKLLVSCLSETLQEKEERVTVMHYYLVLYRARARTHTHTRCGCEFPGMISASSMPVYSQLTEGSPSKYSPGAAVPLTQRCCHCWKRFWNCCCGTAFSAVVTFLCLQYTEIFVPSRQILFLETAKSHSEPNQGK